jgi:CRISPR-associated protein Csb2
MGFDASERAAIDGLTEVWGHGGHDIQLTLLGVGERKDFAGLDKELGECPILASATTWISRTPFVPTRHPKMRKNGEAKVDENGLQIGGPEHELRRLLRLGGFPDPIAIESVVSIDLAGHETRWMSFRTERSRGEGRRASRGLGYGFRILFPQKVNGPIALGYGAHFGLGQFVPDEKDISTI